MGRFFAFVAGACAFVFWLCDRGVDRVRGRQGALLLAAIAIAFSRWRRLRSCPFPTLAEREATPFFGFCGGRCGFSLLSVSRTGAPRWLLRRSDCQSLFSDDGLNVGLTPTSPARAPSGRARTGGCRSAPVETATTEYSGTMAYIPCSSAHLPPRRGCDSAFFPYQGPAPGSSRDSLSGFCWLGRKVADRVWVVEILSTRASLFDFWTRWIYLSSFLLV